MDDIPQEVVGASPNVATYKGTFHKETRTRHASPPLSVGIEHKTSCTMPLSPPKRVVRPHAILTFSDFLSHQFYFFPHDRFNIRIKNKIQATKDVDHDEMINFHTW